MCNLYKYTLLPCQDISIFLKQRVLKLFKGLLLSWCININQNADPSLDFSK